MGEVEKLERTFPGRISVSFVLAGMIQKWDTFADPVNAINKPSQMGPLWMDARIKTGIPFDESIWVEDPPYSSFPACIAVKTAELQSKDVARDYLKLLMEALMLNRRNIAKPEVLAEIAQELSLSNLEFDLAEFMTAYNQNASRSAFREDLKKTKINSITRFPTITLTYPGRKGIIFTGYRPLEILMEAFLAIAPE